MADVNIQDKGGKNSSKVCLTYQQMILKNAKAALR
jgi:hypothetical protein